MRNTRAWGHNMADSLKGFGGIATGLARNPIGIIALFIVLVYGFASVVTAAASHLGAQERLLLVIFMVTFPVLVLAVFAWLVSRHSSALFAPSDFKEEKHYVEALRMRSARLVLDEQLTMHASSLLDVAEKHPSDISPEQIRSAACVEVQAKSLDRATLRDQLQQMCIEYETIRKVLPPSRGRTRAMTEVLLKMRTLGPSVADMLDELKSSDSPGKRLAAVAIMQIDPAKVDFRWLVDRFSQEKPFIFYQSAVALQVVAQQGNPQRRKAAEAAAEEARKVVEAFDGPKDENTLEVLRALVRTPA